MLCCGEDLGMVPACVEPVMKAIGILSLRIHRMPADVKREFEHPNSYHYLNVCTPSCHDTSTVRGWWEESKDTSQRFFNNILGLPGRAPEFCSEWVSQRIIMQHLEARSALAVFPIQDLLGLEPRYFASKDPKEEKINEPSNPNHYWRYRMHVSLDDLLRDHDFSNKLRGMIAYTGRC